MLYGKIVRSPHPHARIVSVDMSAAEKAPGVKTTLLWRDPKETQRNVVMYQGDEIAAVAADTEEHAIDAARLVKVEYEVLPAVIQVDQALAGTAPAVFAASGPAADTTSGHREATSGKDRRRKPVTSPPASSRRRRRSKKRIRRT